MASLANGEARDVRAVASIDPAFHDPARRARVEDLLTSYPDIGKSDLEDIVSFLRSGKQFDVGMVCGNPLFASKIADIRKSNPGSFGSALSHTLWFLVLLMVPLALVCLLPLLLGRS
jgi:hypothetical protein